MAVAAAARSWQFGPSMPLELPRVLLLAVAVCLSSHHHPAYAAVDSYFSERFPVRSLEVVCGVCNKGCGVTTHLLSRGRSPDALFIGTLMATTTLDHAFKSAFQCFTPDTIRVASYPGPTSKGSFARSALPSTISKVGFYTSVWRADASDSVSVEISNRLSHPVNLIGPNTKTAMVARTSTLSAPAYSSSAGHPYLLEAFLASDISIAGKWAASILFFRNPSAKNSFNVTYVVYYTDPKSSTGNTMVYSFEALLTGSSASYSSSTSSSSSSSLKASSSGSQEVNGTTAGDFTSVTTSALTCTIVQPPRPGCVSTSPSWPSCRYVCTERVRDGSSGEEA